MRLLISGGGTGGHVYPALTVAQAVQSQGVEKRERVELLYVGRTASVEERLATRAQVAFQSIQVGGVRGLAPWTAARNLWHVYQSIGRVRAMIRSFKPTAMFATGGFVSVPVIWAGAVEHIPSVIYLPDLEPGWAIRTTARWTTHIAVSFPEVEKHFTRGKVVVTGYPVRSEFFNIDKRNARTKFNLDPALQTVTIFGGSTGAHHINQAAVVNLVTLTKTAQIILITGHNDETWVKEEAARLPGDLRTRIGVFGYLDEDLPHALAAADIVVARAGAATLGEFPALSLPAILVPYPYAGKHQERNAQFLVARGAAVRVDDAALTSDLVPTLKKLLDAPGRLESMSVAMHALAQPRAGSNIATLLYSIEARV